MVEMFRREILQSNVDKQEFVRLTTRLIEVMAELCLLTLEFVEKRKGEALSMREMEEVVKFDHEFRMEQINDPELIEIVKNWAVMEYIKRQKKREEWV